MERTQKKDSTHTVTLSEHMLVNHAVIEEDISQGEQIEKFKVYIYPYSYGKPVLVYEGTTVGHKHICRFPTVRTQKIDIVITEERNFHKLKDINIYYAD